MLERFKNAWDALRNKSPTMPISGGNDDRANHTPMKRGITRSIVNTIYNKIAVDVSTINFNHVKLNEEGRYEETIKDSLNYIFTVSANIDQSGRELVKDIVLTMLNDGVACLVPYKTDVDPYKSDSYKILEARVGTIIQWYPKHVMVSVYDDEIGQRREIMVEKRICAIIQNPFYEIMNSNNSTGKRLIRVLNQLDKTNEENSVHKLDLIIQLPYTTKREVKKHQAEERREELEKQLTKSKLGVGYIDASEKVIQLNRSVENDLWSQAKDLLIELYNQLGFSESLFNGTANEQELLNYQQTTITPLTNAITENIIRKWISVTAQSQGQSFMAFSNTFKFIPVSQLAEMADKLTRNEILSSNEFRSILGYKPSKDPKADQLINSNLNQPDEKAKEDETMKKANETKFNKIPEELRNLINKNKQQISK